MIHVRLHVLLVLFVWRPVTGAGTKATVEKKTTYKPLGLGQSFSGEIIGVGGTSRIGCSAW